jgi:hypothetical protein
MANAKYLKGWVEQELSQVLLSQDNHIDSQKKRLYILNVFPKQGILLVTDSKVRLTILCSQSEIQSMELKPGTVITSKDYYFSTLIQSSLLPYHEYFDLVGVGFPVVMICSSISISSGMIRKSNSWVEMNEVWTPLPFFLSHIDRVRVLKRR